MTTQQKIEKKGYRVTYNMGYKNGEQTTVSVTAVNGNTKITADNVTKLLAKLR